MTDVFQKAVRHVTLEWERLDDFLKAYERHQAGEAKADLAYLKVLVPTTMHGIFELDQRDVLKALYAKRDAMEKELQGVTATGKSIKAAPAGDSAP